MTAKKSVLAVGTPNPTITSQAPLHCPPYRVVPDGLEDGQQTFEIREPSKKEIEHETMRSL